MPTLLTLVRSPPRSAPFSCYFGPSSLCNAPRLVHGPCGSEKRGTGRAREPLLHTHKTQTTTRPLFPSSTIVLAAAPTLSSCLSRPLSPPFLRLPTATSTTVRW